MGWFALFLLVVAVSLDSFGVGFTYGLRKMKIPFRSIVIISTCSAIVLLAAMGIGTLIEAWIAPHLAERFGGLILVFIGLWVLFQTLRSKQPDHANKREKTLINFEIKSLGIVIQVLEKPMVADFDDSGTITGIEAIVLGLALSLDAFGAGIGAALIGYSPFITAVSVACMSSLFVLIGMKFGYLCSKLKWIEKLSILPACLLIILGMCKL